MGTDERKWGHARVPPEIFQDMQETAKQEDRTLAAVLRRAWALYKERGAANRNRSPKEH